MSVWNVYVNGPLGSDAVPTKFTVTVSPGSTFSALPIIVPAIVFLSAAKIVSVKRAVFDLFEVFVILAEA